ncbi:MAG: hypothetical protein ACJ76I_12330 [Gaiellaceae bacterium]
MTVVVGLAAIALVLLPLALRHQRPTLPDPVQGTSTFWALPLDGGPPRLVARVKGQFGFPVPTADGRALLATKSTMLGKTAVWSIPLNGGAPRWIGRAPANAQPSWSPDRTLLASSVANGRIDEIGLYDLTGRHVRTITPLHGEGGVSFPSWGGSNIAFVRMSRPTTGWRLDVEVWRASGGPLWSKRIAYPNGSVTLAPDGRRLALLQVHKLQLLTEHSRRVLATDAAQELPVWTPDGRSLVYLDVKERLVVQDVATRARRVIATGRIAEPSISPDGRTVYALGFGSKPAVNIPK